MTTFKRICIQDYCIQDSDGEVFELKRGREYLTSAEQGHSVVVFSLYWVAVPSNIFAGATQFT